jgi:hypothetical protein
VAPSITLHSDDGGGGVRKTDLVRCLHDYLFDEEAAPVVYTEKRDGEADEVRMETTLGYLANWMSGGEDERGEKISLCETDLEVFLYCCDAGRFGMSEAEVQGERLGGIDDDEGE